MYQIVISLCLLIPAIANADEYDLLKRMQSALDNTFAVSTNLLKTQLVAAQNDVDSILATILLQEPFWLDPAPRSEDELIEITLPAASGSDQYEIGKYSEPANECAEFLTKNFGNKKEEVGKCSEFQLQVLSSYKENLLQIFETNLHTFELFKTSSISCDRHSTDVIPRMVDALCVRKIQVVVENVTRKAEQAFAMVVRDVRKIEKTWTRNLLDCLTSNQEPTVALEYSRACKLQLESDYPFRKT